MTLLSTAKLQRLKDEPIDERYKGLFFEHETSIAEIEAAALNINDPQFGRPILTLRESALKQNLETMRRFCLEHDAQLVPHTKTTTSPQLIQHQLLAGAAGITVANVGQARLMRSYGATNIVIANQVLRTPELHWIWNELQAHDDVQIHVLADSAATVDLMEDRLQGADKGVGIPVLLEVGFSGGRAGARSEDSLIEAADKLHGSEFFQLRGLEGFEGLMPGSDRNEKAAHVAEYLEQVKRVFELLRDREILASGSWVSFGGSKFFDVVAETLDTTWRRRHGASLMLRSGCYLTHDHGTYRQDAPAGLLVPALELRAVVLSVPEADRAIVSFGKRDVPFDSGLPTPLKRIRAGAETDLHGVAVTGLDDQHAYFRFSGDDLQLGDEVIVGISHPCTAFDRWTHIPVINDDDDVLTVVRTHF